MFLVKFVKQNYLFLVVIDSTGMPKFPLRDLQDYFNNN